MPLTVIWGKLVISMSDADTKDVLIPVLELMKLEAEYLYRQQCWIVALADTVRKNPQLAAVLEQHPLYDQGPALELRSRDVLLQRLDELIQQLKDGR